MPWNNDQLDAIGNAQELHVSSYRQGGELRRWTPIWVVRVGDELFVRSAFGNDGGWYRWAMRTGVARVRAGGVETDVALEPVTDTATNERVGNAYESKYADQPTGLEPMVSPPAAASTVRLIERP